MTLRTSPSTLTVLVATLLASPGCAPVGSRPAGVTEHSSPTGPERRHIDGDETTVIELTEPADAMWVVDALMSSEAYRRRASRDRQFVGSFKHIVNGGVGGFSPREGESLRKAMAEHRERVHALTGGYPRIYQFTLTGAVPESELGKLRPLIETHLVMDLEKLRRKARQRNGPG